MDRVTGFPLFLTSVLSLTIQAWVLVRSSTQRLKVALASYLECEALGSTPSSEIKQLGM